MIKPALKLSGLFLLLLMHGTALAKGKTIRCFDATWVSCEKEKATSDSVEPPVAKDQYYKEIGEFINGYAWVISFNSKMGIIDKVERLVVDTLFDAISDFDPISGTCWVKPFMKYSFLKDGYVYEDFPSDGGWGLIGREGNYLLDTVYDRASVFRNGYAVVGTRQYKGLARPNGSFVFPCVYNAIYPQKNGTCLLREKDQWGLGDTSGTILVKPCWTNITPFLGIYAVFRMGDTLGIVNRSGNMVYNVEAIYNRNSKSLADSLEFFETDWTGMSETVMISMENQIREYHLIDSVSPEKNKTMLKNRAVVMACENYFLNNKLHEDRGPEIYFDEEKYKSEQDWLGIPMEGYNYTLSIEHINQRSFTLHQLIENFYIPPRGPGYTHYTHYLFNYGFEKDSVHRLQLRDLFIPGYRQRLNQAIIKGMKDIDDPDIDFINPEMYLEHIEHEFMITPKGVVFYLRREDALSDDEYVELLVPYTAIRSIVNKKGVLGEFVK
jgi:hypothetical protein